MSRDLWLLEPQVLQQAPRALALAGSQELQLEAPMVPLGQQPVVRQVPQAAEQAPVASCWQLWRW